MWRLALRTCHRLLRLQHANATRPSRQIAPIAAHISAGVCSSSDKSAAPAAAAGATKSLNKHAFRKPKGGGPQPAKGSKEKKPNEEQDTLNSILKNYRDRAKERRTVEVKSDIETEAEIMKLAGGYRAVAPVGAAYEQLDRRKKKIDESK